MVKNIYFPVVSFVASVQGNIMSNIINSGKNYQVPVKDDLWRYEKHQILHFSLHIFVWL